MSIPIPWCRRIPIALVLLRLSLGPVVMVAAIFYPDPGVLGICLVCAFLSDYFDGVIARRLGIATARLRRLDSAADSAFYLCALFAAWNLHRDELAPFLPALGALFALEVVRYAFDLWKFRREASYHMWSSKLWGLWLFVGFFSLLALQTGGWPVALAIYFGILADLEGLAISFVLRRWQTDVPTIFHALRARAAA